MRGVFCSDIHARADRPRCRIDGGKFIGDEKAGLCWQANQRADLATLAAIANERKTILGCIGDIFNKGHVPDGIVNDFITMANQVELGVRILCGNHDLPGHNFKRVTESSIGILLAMAKDPNSKIRTLKKQGCYQHFGSKIIESAENPDVLFLHRLVFESQKELPPNVNATTAPLLLAEFPDKKWIITGDMHRGFHYEKKGRHVINCGCINRQDAVEIEYTPSVWFIDTEKEVVERIPLLADAHLVEDSYLSSEKDRTTKLTAFAEAIKRKKEGKLSLSFDKNIERSLEENRAHLGAAVVDEVLSLMEGEEE